MTEKTRLRWDPKSERWYSGSGRMKQWVKHCITCEQEFIGAPSARTCRACSSSRYQKRLSNYREAHYAVQLAIKAGLLRSLKDGSTICSQCGVRPAQVYDHRDYCHPLDVQAVCLRCNSELGPAEQHKALVIKFPKNFKRRNAG